MKNNIADLLVAAINLASGASEVVLGIYHKPHYSVDHSGGGHLLLTEADEASNAYLETAFNQLTPDIPVLSEEGEPISFAERQKWSRYWLIDPLDGTREFVKASGEFCINIALIEQGRAVLGVVFVPTQQTCYFAQKGGGAFKQVVGSEPQQIHTRKKPANKDCIVLTGYRRDSLEEEAFLAALGEAQRRRLGAAIKICLLAEGKADVYPRFADTSEWDTAAGQCILEEAGGAIYDRNMNILAYNGKDSLLNPSFLAVGDKEYDWPI